MSLGPRVSHEELVIEMKWSEFYSNLLRDLRNQERFYKTEPGLERLIGFLEKVCNFDGSSNFMTQDIQEPVSDYKLFLNLGYLLDKYNIPKKQDNVFFNFSADLLRSLKRIKNDEAKFQIPYHEWRVARDFIDMMSSPPHDICDGYGIY